MIFFWHFSVRYNVSFVKIIHISMPHRLNVFLAFFHEILFSCIKNLNKKKILKIKITVRKNYQFVLNILYYRLYDLQI